MPCQSTHGCAVLREYMQSSRKTWPFFRRAICGLAVPSGGSPSPSQQSDTSNWFGKLDRRKTFLFYPARRSPSASDYHLGSHKDQSSSQCRAAERGSGQMLMVCDGWVNSSIKLSSAMATYWSDHELYKQEGRYRAAKLKRNHFSPVIFRRPLVDQ